LINIIRFGFHTVMWLLSYQAILRSFRMMHGFGVHTFVWKEVFTKVHEISLGSMLGIHSLVWDEAMKIQGVDPDFPAVICEKPLNLVLTLSMNCSSKL